MKYLIFVLLFLVQNARAGNPAVIYGSGGRGAILPANGLEFKGKETLNGDEVVGFKNTASTGWISGGALSIGAPTSTVSITAGVGYVIDNITDPAVPVFKRVEFGPFTNEAVTNIGVSPITILYIDANGALEQVTSLPVADTFRDKILLGALSHPDFATVSSVVDTKVPTGNVGLSVKDLADAIGLINTSGNIFSEAGTDLTIQKNAGTTFQYGANASVNPKDPHDSINLALTPVTDFVYNYRDGAMGYTQEASIGGAIVPGKYDLGTGILVNVPNNRYTIQRIIYRPSLGTVDVVYGFTLYNTLANAEAAIQSEVTDINPLILGGTSLRSWLIVKGDTTDLSDTSRAKFIAAGRFGDTLSGGSTSSTTTLQVAYNNSNQPQIVLDSTRGGIQITDAATPIGSPLFEILSNDTLTSYFSVGVDTVSIDGRFAVSSTTVPSRPCPVMTTIQRDLTTPLEGDCIYNNTSKSKEFFNGADWINVLPSGIPTMAKGALITSDGIANGEFAPCADEEIIVWDSVETSGFKCEAKPVNASTLQSVSLPQNWPIAPTNAPTQIATFTSITVEANTYITVAPTMFGLSTTFTSLHNSILSFNSEDCSILLLRDGVMVNKFSFFSQNTIIAHQAPTFTDFINTAGTYTYTIYARTDGTSCGFESADNQYSLIY